MDKPFTNGKGRGYNAQNQRDQPGACAGSYPENHCGPCVGRSCLTAEKRTLLHNAAEAGSYALDDELQRLIGKRVADFYEYAISQKNGCLVCSIYFQNLLKKNGIDFEHFAFTPKEEILIEYGQAIAEDPKHVPEELFEKLKANFTEEEIVVITAMGVMMIANNYFNDILDVTPDKLV